LIDFLMLYVLCKNLCSDSKAIAHEMQSIRLLDQWESHVNQDGDFMLKVHWSNFMLFISRMIGLNVKTEHSHNCRRTCLLSLSMTHDDSSRKVFTIFPDQIPS